MSEMYATNEFFDITFIPMSLLDSEDVVLASEGEEGIVLAQRSCRASCMLLAKDRSAIPSAHGETSGDGEGEAITMGWPISPRPKAPEPRIVGVADIP